MVERRKWSAIGGVALAGGLLAGFGCSSLDVAPDEFPVAGPEYELGGQTGSLVPDCGVAPLSSAGGRVPAGDALAVLYVAGCPEQAVAEQLALVGTGANGVRLELVPLQSMGVFLVRADQSLAGGDYQLTLGTSVTSNVRVGGEAPAVPLRLQPLRLLPEEAACVERLRFELPLNDAALAYAPLSRFDVSIDGGAEQLWVDYGALPVESTAEGTRGLIELPRCGSQGCLEGGTHHLQLRVSVAGEGLQPEPLELTFEVNCPTATDAGNQASEAGCALPRSAGPALPSRAWALASCLSWFVVRRRARRRAKPYRAA